MKNKYFPCIMLNSLPVLQEDISSTSPVSSGGFFLLEVQAVQVIKNVLFHFIITINK